MPDKAAHLEELLLKSRREPVFESQRLMGRSCLVASETQDIDQDSVQATRVKFK